MLKKCSLNYHKNLQTSICPLVICKLFMVSVPYGLHDKIVQLFLSIGVFLKKNPYL